MGLYKQVNLEGIAFDSSPEVNEAQHDMGLTCVSDVIPNPTESFT